MSTGDSAHQLPAKPREREDDSAHDEARHVNVDTTLLTVAAQRLSPTRIVQDRRDRLIESDGDTEPSTGATATCPTEAMMPSLPAGNRGGQ